MYSAVMESFLSKENLMTHLSHLNDFKLKYSILSKSFTELLGKDYDEILSMRLPRDVRDEALKLNFKIKAHELYFSSFAEHVGKCDFLKAYFSSKEAFLYEVFVAAKSAEAEFLFISTDKYGKVQIFTDRELWEKRFSLKPRLSLDLAEHSYFSDYGFMREEYLKRAVSYLDIGRLENT